MYDHAIKSAQTTVEIVSNAYVYQYNHHYT